MQTLAFDAAPDILVVDDDPGIRELLAASLERQGMRVRSVADGAGLWAALAEASPQLLVLDLNLPGADGLSLCRDLRQRGHALPIIMLTARADPLDRIIGLELGADDYLAKPFEPRELAARIRSVLRRVGANALPSGPRSNTRRWRFAGWLLDIAARELRSPQDQVVLLTSSEFRLLQALVEHAGQVLSRDQLLNLTQGRDAGPFDRSVDLHISRLRAKLRDDPRTPALLKTVRNEGYLLAAQAEAQP